MFGSLEKIDEDRVLNFAFPPATPDVLRDFERAFDFPNVTEEERYFLKFTEQVGNNHSFSQQFSYNEANVSDFLQLSAAGSLPSTRNNFDLERTMVGLNQTSVFGDSNLYIFEGYLQYRDHSDFNGPAHPEAGPGTAFNIFSSPFTFGVFGDLGQVAFGNAATPSTIDQEYLAIGPNISTVIGDHEIKAGIDYLNTSVDGSEQSIRNNQLFATADNFATYGPIYSGLYTLTEVGPRNAEGARIELDNDYVGLYVQDDWAVTDNLMLNLGLRWDNDSEFDDDDNIAGRLGIVWTPTERTVVSASAGRFYDRFRLGLVRNVPEFGGADMSLIQDLSYPQGFYNTTTIVPFLVGLCINPFATEAQASGTPCPFGLPTPHYGFDTLNNIVAPGRSPVAPATVITIDNVQELTGLSPSDYLAQVNASVPLFGFGPTPWYWGPFGAITHPLLPASPLPVQIDPAFETPYTDAFHLGLQQQFGQNHLVTLDLHHKEIKNILGIRETNLGVHLQDSGQRAHLHRVSGSGHSRIRSLVRR